MAGSVGHYPFGEAVRLTITFERPTRDMCTANGRLFRRCDRYRADGRQRHECLDAKRRAGCNAGEVSIKPP
jgi:hypothetical protein